MGTNPHDLVQAPEVINREGGDILGLLSGPEPAVHLIELQQPDGRHDARQVEEHAGTEPVANCTVQTDGQIEQKFLPVRRNIKTKQI